MNVDFPHPEGSWPQTARFLAESFHDLPDDELRKMLGGTAAEVYGFDVDALAPIVERIGPRRADLDVGTGIGRTEAMATPRGALTA